MKELSNHLAVVPTIVDGPASVSMRKSGCRSILD